jgi:hypothetical protein
MFIQKVRAYQSGTFWHEAFAHISVRLSAKALCHPESECGGVLFVIVLKKKLKYGPFTAGEVDAALFRANLIGIGTRTLSLSKY